MLPVRNFLEFHVVMDEGLSQSEWFEAFHAKVPLLKQEDFKKALSYSSMRINGQYSWETFQRRLQESTSSKTNVPRLFLTLLASEDPSKLSCLPLKMSTSNLHVP